MKVLLINPPYSTEERYGRDLGKFGPLNEPLGLAYLAANLERGGNGIASDGTFFATQMQVAATDDETMAYRLGLVCGREARAVGCNWSFAPVIDLDLNYQNPITNTRTYGSDPERVLRMAIAYLKGIHECGRCNRTGVAFAQ